MKKAIYTLLFFALLGGGAFAQDLSKPKSGNAIRLKDYSITIEQGKSASFDMWVVQAKKYKLKLGEPKASGKEGITLTFGSRSDDDTINYNVSLDISEDLPTGDYPVTLKVPGTGRNTVKNALIMVKVVRANP